MGLKCQPFLDGMDFALKPGIDEQCILLFDEMAIKKDLQLRTTDDSVMVTWISSNSVNKI